MPRVELCLSANAGFVLRMGEKRIWIDAVHDQKFPSMSTLTPMLYEQLLQHPLFAAPDLVFFTHCHGDHFSYDMARQVKERWPNTVLALPEQRFPDQLFLTGNRIRIETGDITLSFLSLVHEGAQYVEVPHYALLVEQDGYRILFTGDCQVAGKQLIQHLRGVEIHLAVVDFPWLTLRKGREFLMNELRPRQVAVCHLPFPQDDLYGSREAALRDVSLLEYMDARVFLEPFQTEIFEIIR